MTDFRTLAVVTIVAARLASPTPAGATMPPMTGSVPEPLSRAFEEGLFGLESAPAGLAASAVQSRWRIPVIMVSFSDSLLRHSAADLETVLFDTTGSTATGSVYDYYQWVSGGRLTISGQVVATVVLPKSRAFYAGNNWGLSLLNTPENSYGAVLHALTQCHTRVDWSEFDMDRNGYVDMLWFVHAGIGGEASPDRNNLWSITSTMSGRWRDGRAFETVDPVPGAANQFMRIDRFTVLPELSPLVPGRISEIGVYCHEFGHALGLPDFYDTANLTGPLNTGTGNWSLMGSGGYGGDGRSPQYPTHLGAWPTQFLGWDRTIRPTRDTTIVLEPFARERKVVEFWFQGESNPEHFLIENRQRVGFDRNLPMSGLIIYHVNEAVILQRLPTNNINAGLIPGLVLVEADGDGDLVNGRNRGDANDPFPGAMGRTHIDDDTQPNTRTFAQAATNIAIRDIELVGEDVRWFAQVRARGWLPAEDFSGSEFAPVGASVSARATGVDDFGMGYRVGTELRSGLPQVILRSGHVQWGQPFQVSRSTRAALDPTLAILPGGDLAIVWSDSRSGRAELFFRSRIRGVWSDERRLVELPGDCRSPALAVDGRGTLHLAFQHNTDGQQRIRFMRFTYFSPFGQPVAVSEPAARPSGPAVAVAPDGLTYVIWSDKASPRARLWMARCDPQGRFSPPEVLTPLPRYSQLSFSADVDSSGSLHTVWQVSGPGVYQIHYQRRLPDGALSPVDTLIESQSSLCQNPVVAADSHGGLHLVFEAANSGVVQARYKRFKPGSGWDAFSTELTLPSDGEAANPRPLPFSPDDLIVLYVGYADQEAHFMARRRLLESPALLAVPAATTPSPVHLLLSPNPLRAGAAIDLWCSGDALEASPKVEFFDVSGRRVATAGLERHGDRWTGRVGAGMTSAWPSGMYFARVGRRPVGAARLVVIR